MYYCTAETSVGEGSSQVLEVFVLRGGGEVTDKDQTRTNGYRCKGYK